jgi:hypothetical protein
VNWQSNTHFKAVAAHAMRRLLTEHARNGNRQKRRGGWSQVLLTQQRSGLTSR